MGPDSNNRRIMSQMNERQQKSVNEVYNAMMPRQDETLQGIFNLFFVILWSNSPKFIKMFYAHFRSYMNHFALILKSVSV